MMSTIVKSIALAAVLVTSTTRSSSMAFTTSTTTTSSQRGRVPCRPSMTLGAASSSSSSSSSSPEEDAGPSSSSSSSLTSSHDERLGDVIELPQPPHEQRRHVQRRGPDDDARNDEPRSSEFVNLEPPPPASPLRLARLESESNAASSYVRPGTDEYWDLVDEVSRLELDLKNAIDAGVSDTALRVVRNMLRKARSKDPEYVYGVASNAANIAERLGRERECETYREEGRRARRMMPQFNLEGLWVGKYGSHGFEMINVTYVDDRLIAYKVTGDRNIPRGEITFTADLSVAHRARGDDAHDGGTSSAEDTRTFPGGGGGSLDPIILSEGSARKWGTRRLSRYRGSGHAAEPGYVNHQFMEGQLVVIGGGEYFSFAWVPLEHQIFFGRPSPELAIRMLREGGGTRLTAGVGLDVPGPDANVREMAEYADRCLEVTCDVICDESREGKVDPFSCIWHGDDDEYCYFE